MQTATRALQIKVVAKTAGETVVVATSDLSTLRTTLVDENGNFTFSGLQDGTYILRVGVK